MGLEIICGMANSNLITKIPNSQNNSVSCYWYRNLVLAQGTCGKGDRGMEAKELVTEGWRRYGGMEQVKGKSNAVGKSDNRERRRETGKTIRRI